MHLCVEERCRAELHVGAVWKDGACAICSMIELSNCPEEKCTADLHEGALLDIWDSCRFESIRPERVQVDALIYNQHKQESHAPPHPPFNVSGVLVPVVGTEGRA